MNRFKEMPERVISIFVDAHVFDHGYEGTTTYIKGIYSSLVEDSRFQITLAGCNIERLKKEFPHSGFRFQKLRWGSSLLRLFVDIPSLLRKGNFHFAHFQYISPFARKCNYITTIHDLLFLDFPEYFPVRYKVLRSVLFRRSARKADVLCSVSEYSREAISRHFGIDKGRICLTPNAVAEHAVQFSQTPPHQLQKYILFVSRMEPRKNHLLMLRAYHELALYREGYSMVFVGRTKDVGSGDYWKYYNQLPDAVQKKVMHLENVPDQELRALYGAASLFVYPSLAEGFGIPPLEAAMAGCRVLCSNRTAMADFSFFGEFLFDPEDEDKFRRMVRHTLDITDYPHDRIRASILQTYNWKKIASDFGELLVRKFEATRVS